MNLFLKSSFVILLKYLSDITKDYIFDTDIDLGKLGIQSGDNVVIEGARNMKNNSGNFLFKVESFSSRKITFGFL